MTPNRSHRRSILAVLSTLVILAPIAQAQRGSSGGGRGGGGGSSSMGGGGGGRSSFGGGGGGGARSAPSAGGGGARSAPSGGSFSGGSRASAPSRAPSSSAAPSRSSSVSPRVSRPSAPTRSSSAPTRTYSPEPSRTASPYRSAPERASPDQSPRSGPQIRYAPSERGGFSGSRSSSGPSSRVYDTGARRAPEAPRGDFEGGFGGISREGTTPGSTPDLSSWGRNTRTRVPVLTGSKLTDRSGPGASRTAAAADRGVRPDWSRESDRGKASALDRVRLPSPTIDRGTILERYKNPGRGAPSVDGRQTPSRSSDSDLSRLRGAGRGTSSPSAKPQGSLGRADRDGGRSKVAPSSPKSSGSGSSARSPTRSAQAEGQKRLARKVESDPVGGRQILERGKFVSSATDVATRTALGVGVGVTTGWGSTSCFWDPCVPSSCAPYWNWWCTPGWSWWWSTCCTPWWGFGWGFGYWSDCFGFWYSGYPYYSYYPSYYAPYPAYYSTVIYDTYAPPPEEEVAVADPGYADPEASARGEGSIRVAGGEGAGGSRMASATEFLNLGDQAFREGRYSEAVHYYAKAVELEPQQGVLHLILSDALFATGDYHYAAYSLRRALELDPTVVDDVVDKHSFYVNDPTEFDRQVQLLERYLADHFLDDDARLLLAANYLFGGQPAQSVDLLQSPFSVAIRESGAGKVLLDRAQALRRASDAPR